MEIHFSENVVICKESPAGDDISAEEIREYAKSIGVDCNTEKYLLPVAKEALLQKLPKNWIPCLDKIRNRHFYYNTKTCISQWEHPLDDVYKRVVKQVREYYKEGNVEIIKFKNLYEMLPLRQNRKPQLIPIEQLLNHRRERRPSSGSYTEKINDYERRPRSSSAVPHSGQQRNVTKKSVTFASEYDQQRLKQASYPSSYTGNPNNSFEKEDAWLNTTLVNAKIPESVHIDINLFEDNDNKRSLNNELSSPVSQMRYSLVDEDEYQAVQDKSNRLLRENRLLRRDRNLTEESKSFDNVIRKSNKTFYNADSAVFTGSNIDDTSKNVMSDFSDNSQLACSSDGSSDNSPSLLNSAVEVVAIKPKHRVIPAIVNRNIPNMDDVRDTLHFEMKRLLNTEINELKNTLKKEMSTYVSSYCEKFQCESQELRENQRKQIEEAAESIIKRFKLSENEIISSIKREHDEFKNWKNSYVNDVEYQKNALTNSVQNATQQINNEVNKVLERITDKQLDERFEKHKNDITSIVIDKQPPSPDSNLKEYHRFKTELLDDVRKENESHFEKIRFYVDKRINDVSDVIRNNVNNWEQCRLDLDQKVNLENAKVMNQQKEELRLSIEVLKKELIGMVIPDFCQKEFKQIITHSDNIYITDQNKKDCSENRNLVLNDIAVQTNMENSHSSDKQDNRLLLNTKLDKLLDLSSQLEQRISDLTSVQEMIRADNSDVKEKYSNLEDKFNQLVNITDISISDLDINVPRYCENRMNTGVFIDTTESTFSPSTGPLHLLGWPCESYIPIESTTNACSVDEEIANTNRLLNNIEKDLHCYKQKQAFNFQHPF